MGKQKIERLLSQLQDNQTQDIQNTTAIFTVAQAAVNQLEETLEVSPEIASLPPTLQTLTKRELLEKYGSYNACRKAAKQAGLTFSKTPSWEKLVTAFSYLNALQNCIHAYLIQHPTQHLKGVSLTFVLDK